MRAKNGAFRLLEEALEIASQGVDGAEVSLIGGKLGLTRFAENDVHQSIEEGRDVLAVRVLKDGRFGRVETTDITREGLDDALRRARMFAQFLPAPKEPGALAPPQSYTAPPEAFDRSTEQASPIDRMSLAGRAILGAHKRGLVTAGLVETRSGSANSEISAESPYALMSTNGIQAYHFGTRARLSVTMARADGLSGWAEHETFALGDIDAAPVVEQAMKKALVKGDLRSVAPVSCPVVFEPAAVAELVAFLSMCSGAEDVESGDSYLCDRSRKLPDSISIDDDYAHPYHRGTPFDAEGVARKKVSLIERGAMKGPVYSLESARRAKVTPTGHRAVHPLYGDREVAQHLVMHGGDSTVSDLIGGLQRGLLVTRLWYVRLVDKKRLTLTGMTRDGTFVVEGGEIRAPVRNMRFNVSLLDLLGRVEAMSRPAYARGVVVPAVRVSEMSFTEGQRA